jgi:hypothetical protein
MKMKKLSIIVPYRDREEHMNLFVPHMEKLLGSQGIDFEIVIVHQCDKKKFNRAKLLNVGFHECPNSDYYAFHDVDMLPLDSDYSYPEGPTHLATEAEQFGYKLPYDGYFGGVTLFDKESFLKINGYSNSYWGWGAEDDDVLLRCMIMGIPTYRKKCRYSSLSHDRDIEQTQYMLNIQKLRELQVNPTKDEISKDGLSNLRYEKLGVDEISENTRMVNVLL